VLVSVAWLKDFIDTGLSVDKLCHALTMAGLEVEGLESEKEGAKDTVIEINVTPNRPDWLSVFGVARELAAILGAKPLTVPAADIRESEKPAEVLVEVAVPDLCPRYAARVIRNVKVTPSPEWLANRLKTVGIRPINNVVDITNYVLMEFGHPLHAFDLSKISKSRILVDLAREGEVFTTLDGIERSLSAQMLTIRDAAGPVALAGIMGGLDSEVTGDTVDVFLESAYFDPALIRKTSKLLGLRSESSYRFERGTDIEGLIQALDRAASLIVQEAGGEICGGRIDVYPTINKYTPSEIKLTTEKTNRILGINLSTADIESIIKRLNFDVCMKGDDLVVTPPTYRRDVMHDIDLIEDIARLYGYNNIPVKLPEGTMPAGRINKRRNLIQRIKTLLRKNGFSEAINYSFMNTVHLDVLGIGESDYRRTAVINLLNPLRAEEAVLRTTLVPALLENLGRNLNRGTSGLKLFELSKVFVRSQGKQLADERLHLAAVLSPETAKTLYQPQVNGFYELKGALETIFHDLKITGTSFNASDSENFLQVGQAAEIRIADKTIGFIGRIIPDVLEHFGTQAGEAYVFELDADGLLGSISLEKVCFRRLPRFPHVDRDMALLAPVSLPSDKVIKAVEEFSNDLITHVRIFDMYQGKGIPEGKKNLAYSVRYQSAERTLTVAEVDSIHVSLIEHIKKTLGVELRE